MDALAELNADAKEVDEAVRVGADIAIGVGEVIDEEDLEEELRELVEETEREQGDVNNEREDVAIKQRLEKLEMQVPKELPKTNEEAQVLVGISAC
jgi:charged multivesicular body protein 7